MESLWSAHYSASRRDSFCFEVVTFFQLYLQRWSILRGDYLSVALSCLSVCFSNAKHQRVSNLDCAVSLNFIRKKIWKVLYPMKRKKLCHENLIRGKSTEDLKSVVLVSEKHITFFCKIPEKCFSVFFFCLSEFCLILFSFSKAPGAIVVLVLAGGL